MSETEFIKLCESKLKECENLNNVPMLLIGEAAQAYMLGRQTILQWVLEMMPLDKVK